MSFSHILGQEGAIATLKAALLRGRAHHAYRFEGPDGVGKELTAFALAQALLCAAGNALGCERESSCDACRRAVTLSSDPPRVSLHPDVAIVERGFYPQEVVPKPETKEISVEQVRTIVLAHAAYPPHEGRARVFLVRRADELSVSAANALLKTLEEPRRGTHFILMSARPDKLLNTIRSRTLPVRFAPLSDEVIRGILTARGVDPSLIDPAIDLAAGSASAALSLVDEEESRVRAAFVSSALSAMEAPDMAKGVALSESLDKDKGEIRYNLLALGASFAREARADAAKAPGKAAVAAARYQAVTRAMASLERNASPGLTMITLMSELRAAVG